MFVSEEKGLLRQRRHPPVDGMGLDIVTLVLSTQDESRHVVRENVVHELFREVFERGGHGLL